jgi:3-hydroxyisobutyrate dehydrogenase-like beta-hydroxyacid dehydrogenase
MTSVPSFEVAVSLAQDLLPYAREDQVFIELSTITPSQAVALAEQYAGKDAVRLDVPVSGGAYGAERAILRMFVGGDEKTVRQCWPIFEVLGDSERIVYCGPAGSGQVVKIVNQLAMGLSNAIYLEAIGYGVHMGIEVDALMQGIGGSDSWRKHFDYIAQCIKNDEATHTHVKFVQLQQFTDDAALHGYDLPLSRALYEFCDVGERISQEEIYPVPSFWHELRRNKISE